MSVYSITKNIAQKSLIYFRHKKVKNKEFTLLANNCVGGQIYHDLGLKFLSPTINMFFKCDDYLLFLENLDEALNANIEQVFRKDVKYPIGKITLKSGKSIILNFMHYKSFLDARTKFIERSNRVRGGVDNIFVLFEAGIETTDELVQRFSRLPYKNKVVITDKEYNLDCALFLDIYGERFRWGKLLKLMPKNIIPKRHIELFDYINWFNTGKIRKIKNYDKYIRKDKKLFGNK